MAQTNFHQFTITGPQMGLIFSAPIGQTIIGRHKDNDLVFVHPLVSRQHARIDCTESTCELSDLGSTHGTQLNHQTITPNVAVTLNSGDEIDIGPFHLVYLLITETTDSESADEAEPTPRAVARSVAAGTMATSEYTPLNVPTAALLSPPPAPPPPETFVLPPGLSLTDSRYLDDLPEIYRNLNHDFLPRFLALLESILAPIEWNANNFDMFLDPTTAPPSFLAWLANWFDMTFDHTWPEANRRALLKEAQRIYSRRGTAWALGRILEIYTGVTPVINDSNANLAPFTFTIALPLPERKVNRNSLEKLIEMNKPAHTNYLLTFEN